MPVRNSVIYRQDWAEQRPSQLLTGLRESDLPASTGFRSAMVWRIDGPLMFYTIACAHDLHLMMFACMFMGRYSDSIDTANKMCRLLSREVIGVKDRPKFAMSLEGYYSMKTHVLVRFGRWQELIDEPLPEEPELYLVSTAMHHYAKGIAHATLKHFDRADEECRRFQESLRRIPRERRFFNNEAHAILAVGQKMLDGELEYHKGHCDAAFASLRESVRLDDNLEYIEPWAWMHPPRHALAALFMEQGHFDEAEAIYRDDLGLSGRIQRCAQHPDNVWALHGLVECLKRRGKRWLLRWNLRTSRSRPLACAVQMPSRRRAAATEHAVSRVAQRSSHPCSIMMVSTNPCSVEQVRSRPCSEKGEAAHEFEQAKRESK
jgi:hypothetical protein